LWTASRDVELRARGRPPLTATLISLRLVSRLDGVTVRTLYGLSNIGEGEAHRASLGAWLLIRSEVKLSLRYAARVWEALPADGDEGCRQMQALAAVQSGLAAWQLRQGADAGAARAVGASLVGRRDLPSLTAAQALFKLFA